MTNHKNTRETFLNRLVVKLKRFMKIEYLNNDNLSDLCTAPTYNEDLNWSKWGPNGDSFFSGDLLETCDI